MGESSCSKPYKSCRLWRLLEAIFAKGSEMIKVRLGITYFVAFSRPRKSSNPIGKTLFGYFPKWWETTWNLSFADAFGSNPQNDSKPHTKHIVFQMEIALCWKCEMAIAFSRFGSAQKCLWYHINQSLLDAFLAFPKNDNQNIAKHWVSTRSEWRFGAIVNSQLGKLMKPLVHKRSWRQIPTRHPKISKC